MKLWSLQKSSDKTPEMHTESTRPGLPPGPKPHFFYGHLTERRKRPLEFFHDNALKYGPMVAFKMGPEPIAVKVFLLSDPDGIQHVLQTHSKNYVKGLSYDRMKPFLGEGLLTSEGDYWRRQRKLAQPAFHQKSLVAMTGTMVQATERLIQRWNGTIAAGTRELDVARELMRLTLGIAGETLFGIDVSQQADRVGQAVSYLIEFTNNYLLSVFPIPLWVPTSVNRAAITHQNAMNEVIHRVIRERRQMQNPPHDLLSMFLAAKDEETGEQMTDRQLRDEIITMFVAGHETTATALSWTFHLLAQNPEWEVKAREECRKVLGGRIPGFEDVPKLKVLHNILMEAMRLYPPAWIIARENLERDRILGYDIPPRTIIAMSPYVMHRLPQLWERPLEFDPTRFEGESKRHKFAFLPFGGGARVCIGSGFAQLEMQIILAGILQNFSLRSVPGHLVETEPMITLRPKHGIRMILEQI